MKKIFLNLLILLSLTVSCGKEIVQEEIKPEVKNLEGHSVFNLKLNGKETTTWKVPAYGTLFLAESVEVKSEDFPNIKEFKIEYIHSNPDFNFTCYYTANLKFSKSDFYLEGCENEFSILDFKPMEPIVLEQNTRMTVTPVTFEKGYEINTDFFFIFQQL